MVVDWPLRIPRLAISDWAAAGQMPEIASDNIIAMHNLTTLQDQLVEAAGRFPDEPFVDETYAWLKQIDVAAGDLDAIRRDMADRIMALQDLGYHQRTPEELLADVDLAAVTITTFPEPWRFKPDPRDVGVKQQWFDANMDISQWGQVRTDIEKGWEKQGFAEAGEGHGWYRAPLPLGEQDLTEKHAYLYFEAVDEDCWVYLNGQTIFEHTYESSGLIWSEIWLTPFVAPLKDVPLHGHDALAVRVLNRVSMGGIWKPVHLSDHEQPGTDDGSDPRPDKTSSVETSEEGGRVLLVAPAGRRTRQGDAQPLRPSRAMTPVPEMAKDEPSAAKHLWPLET